MEKVYWLPGEDCALERTTWLRDINLMKFIRKVEEQNSIEGIIIDSETNNIGFILK